MSEQGSAGASAPDDADLARDARAAVAKLGRDVLAYGSKTAVVKVAQVALLPVYLVYLGPTDFGILALAGVYAGFIAIFQGFALESAILRLYHEWPDDERRRRTASIWWFSSLSALAVTLLFHVVSRQLSHYAIRQVPFDPYLKLALWTGLFMTLESIPTMLLRVREQARGYSIVTLVSFAIREVFKLVMVVGYHGHALGALRAGLYASGLLAVGYVVWMAKTLGFTMSLSHLRGPLGFVLPSIPGSIVDTVSKLSDRFFLEKFIPIGQLGVYDVARRFGTLVREINAPLKTAWMPYAIRISVQEGAKGAAVVARLSSYYVGVIASAGLALALLGGDVAQLAGGRDFTGLRSLVAVFVTIGAIDSCFTLLGTTVYIARRTGRLSAVMAVSFGALLLANVVLIPRFMVWGAVAAVLVYMGVQGCLTFWVGRRHYVVPYQWKRLLFIAGSAVVVYLTGSLALHTLVGWIALVARAGLAAAYVAGVFFVILGIRRELGAAPREAAHTEAVETMSPPGD